MAIPKSLESKYDVQDVAAPGADSVLFRHVFNSEMVGMIVTDSEGKVLDANEHFLRMLGLSREALERGEVRWDRLTPPEWLDASRRAVAELESFGFARPFEKEYLRGDGARVPVLVGSTRIPELRCNITFVLDISERRRLEAVAAAAHREAHAQREHLFSLFMNAPVAIAVLQGPEHVFVLANRHYSEIVDHREVLGKRLLDALPEIEGQGFVELLDGVFQTGTPCFGTEAPARLRTQSGAFREAFFNFTYAPTRDRDGKVDGVMAVGVEVTQMVEARRRTEELSRRVQLSEERHRVLVEAFSQIAWTTSPSGEMLPQQPRWGAFTGEPAPYTPDAWVKSIHPEDRVRVQEEWRDALRRRTPYESEHRVRRHDGRYRTMQVRAVPVLEPDGSVREWVGVHTDITDQRRADLHLRFLSEASRTLAESLDPETMLSQLADLAVRMVTSICIVDRLEPDGSLRRAVVRARDGRLSPLVPELFKFPPPLSVTDPIAQGLRSGAPVLMESLDASGRDAIAINPAHRELLERIDPRSLILTPMRARGRAFGAITFVRDDTMEPFGVDDLQMTAEFSHRVASALETVLLLAELNEAVRARDEFLSVASHELKTPLTPLALKLESIQRLVRSIPESPVSAKLERELDVGKRQVRKLSELVDDLLDVARIGAGRVTLDVEPTDVAALVREVAVRFEAEGARAGVPLSVTAPQELPGMFDRARVDQIVTNLVSNAIKYGANKPARLTVSSRGRTAVIEVADQGIGIAAEALGRIFDRFERAVSHRNYSGLGLGLYITRSLVEVMGGTLHVQSEPGKGSTFTVELPLRAAPDETASAP